jgi:long-chain acyl-CoA synthetase
LVAIVVPDADTLTALVAAKLPQVAAKKLSYAELCKVPEVNALVLKQMTKVGKQAELRGFEHAKALYLESEPFAIENDLLTPTFKVKRPQAKKRYEEIIAQLYEALDNQVEPAKAKL